MLIISKLLHQSQDIEPAGAKVKKLTAYLWCE